MYFHNHGWSINRKNRTKKTQAADEHLDANWWSWMCLKLGDWDVVQLRHLNLLLFPSEVKRKIHQNGPWEKGRWWNLPRRTAESFCERCHDWHVIHDQRWRGTWQIMMDLIRFGGFRSHGGVGWKAAHNAVARSFDLRHQWRVAPAAFLIFELQDG